MRIVFDTNVWVSALLWRGPAHRLMCAAEVGRFSLAASQESLTELDEVLRRPKFQGRLSRRAATVEDLLISVIEMVDLVAPAGLSIREIPELQDPDDAVFLALALAAGAPILVSGDRHLLDLGEWRSVRILDPGEASKILRVR